MKSKTLAELEKLHDKLVVELAVLSQKIDGQLTAAERKRKRAKK
jgi:hypothetical protein